MFQRLRWMLLGIFLAILSVWALLTQTVFFMALGFYFLPLAAIACFLGGFFGNSPEKDPPDYPTEHNEKESDP